MRAPHFVLLSSGTAFNTVFVALLSIYLANPRMGVFVNFLTTTGVLVVFYSLVGIHGGGERMLSGVFGAGALLCLVAAFGAARGERLARPVNI